ncbi:MAG: hypothetical protein MZV63_12700 [Marinilabiliales bacterium]|nr:hypothetical protein [Marinilabiliales bacterium]
MAALFVLIVFSIAYAYLKPHRLHHSRPLSTLALKGSYLVYLHRDAAGDLLSPACQGRSVSEVFDGPGFFVFLLVIFVPTVAIFSRKITHFSTKRVWFNLIFAAVNILMILTVLLLYRF